ncbi:hypothetical protein [Thermogemmatispora sp.]|uniref:hypothetical protein n=1 Tax=Thermogemmatispora sp. TaxID=1968838 RepID=UPI001D722A0A|nr:hypothetical protein [Thermogemmatispora sp.]MBX5449391.1 hypothetical protein [Thermogemmatispora sp.]
MTQVPSDHEAEPQAALADLTKKLRKRERRLLQRLQKAQTARAKAVERLNRAQARLEKRTARLQRLEERLSLVRQQLQTLESLTKGVHAGLAAGEPDMSAQEGENGFSSVSEKEKESARQGDAPLSAPSVPASIDTNAASSQASEAASGNPMINELQALTHLLLEEGRREEQLRASWERSCLPSPPPPGTAEDTSAPPSDQPQTAFEAEANIWSAFEQHAEDLGKGREPDWVSQLVISKSGLEEGLRASESELSKPDARSIGEGISAVPTTEEPDSQPAFPATIARSVSPPTERSQQAALYGFDEPPELPEEVESGDEEAAFSPMTSTVLASSLLPASPAELVREARAAAEAAEEAARLAIERAALAAARLEQLPSGRHLVQELAEVEQAVAQASHAAEVAQTTARAVERWAQAISTPVSTSPQSEVTSQLSPAQQEQGDPSNESSTSTSASTTEEAGPSTELMSAQSEQEPSTFDQEVNQLEETSRSRLAAEQADLASSAQDQEEKQTEPEKIEPPTAAQEHTAEASGEAMPGTLQAEKGLAQVATSSELTASSTAMTPLPAASTSSKALEEVSEITAEPPAQQMPAVLEEVISTSTLREEAGPEQDSAPEKADQAKSGDEGSASAAHIEPDQTSTEPQQADAEVDRG